MRLIHLASPYNHNESAVRILRRGANAAVLAYYAHEAKDLCLHSTIVHWGPVADLFDLPHDFDFWRDQDLFFIQKSSALWVVPLEGWHTSYGLNLELEYARDIGKEIQFIQVGHHELFLREDGDDITTYAPRDLFEASPHWTPIDEKSTPPDTID